VVLRMVFKMVLEVFIRDPFSRSGCAVEDLKSLAEVR
jgi:hypothetical protein